jgi:CheY-like chemotaxis protein
LDGLSVMQELKAEPSTAEIPIVICTCRDAPADIAAARAAGVRDYWVKGMVDRVNVGERVAELLRQDARKIVTATQPPTSTSSTAASAK